MRTDEDIQAEIEVKAKELAAIKLKEIELAKKRTSMRKLQKELKTKKLRRNQN